MVKTNGLLSVPFIEVREEEEKYGFRCQIGRKIGTNEELWLRKGERDEVRGGDSRQEEAGQRKGAPEIVKGE